MPASRRRFLQAASAAAVLRTPLSSLQAPPNFLWISCEDMSPDLGCYGDRYAITPHLDRLAAESVRYTNAFSVYGVCAPSRSSIITAMYPNSIGTHHMRSQGVPPPFVRCFTEYLRAAGYYCTNNVKTDYNFDSPLTAWDDSSNRAHWRGRSAGQPFFAVFNLTVTHESQIRLTDAEFAARTAALAAAERHDPARAALPPYYPDTPVVRRDWARYHDLITVMDRQAAELLSQLERDGLAGDTIVFFWSDHGRGLPRAKRWVYDSGIRVPLLVRFPDRRGAGTTSDRLVSLMDLGPTLLSLAGVEIPRHMQGQAFLGERARPPRRYVHAARDRMDETYDLIRATSDGRFKYIHNLQACKPYAQYIDYAEQMPTLREWRRWNKEGTLTGPQRLFFAPEKPPEELYDTRGDPHEIRNLAASAAHRAVLERLRAETDRWRKEIGDLGATSEDELKDRMRPGGQWSVTANPTFRATPAGIEIACATPGASIAYRTPPGPWKLYSTPVPAANLRAKACRLGFRDSAEVEYRG
jgi:uncharacterized sulfatase